jgi:hypothetical protein
MGRAAASSGVSSGGGANCLMTFRRTPVAGCFLRTTGLYPKSLSTKKTISSSLISTSLLHTTFNHRCMDAGTMASGHAEIRCSPSFTNSECRRRTSRNWVVRNLGRLV